MANYISMLRGINVSGQKKILMKDLRAMYEALGYDNISSYVQSGNVVFSTKKKSIASLEKTIKAEISNTFSFDVPTLVRDASYFEMIIKNNPYPKATEQDAKSPYVLFLESVPEEIDIEMPTKETGEYIIKDDAIYINYPEGAGRSKLTTNFFERKLKVSGTMRNWKTVLALHEMVQAL